MATEEINPRKAELRQLSDRADACVARLSGFLKAAETAMSGGAWVSSTTTGFTEGLSHARTSTTSAALASAESIRAEYANEPVTRPAGIE